MLRQQTKGCLSSQQQRTKLKAATDGLEWNRNSDDVLNIIRKLSVHFCATDRFQRELVSNAYERCFDVLKRN